MQNSYRIHTDSMAQVAYLLASLEQGKPLERLSSGVLPEAQPKVQLVVVASRELAAELIGDLEFFGVEKLRPYPAWEVLPFEALSPAPEISGQRLYSLSTVTTSGGILVAPIAALMQRVLSQKRLASLQVELRVGMKLEREKLIALLPTLGYQRSSLVEEPGHFAVRGSVVDFSTFESCIRAEFFDEELESLRLFDGSTQRSTGKVNFWTLRPVSELCYGCLESSDIQPVDLQPCLDRLRARAAELDVSSRQLKQIEEHLTNRDVGAGLEHYLPFFEDRLESVWDYLPDDSLVTIFDEHAVESAAVSFSHLISERVGRLEKDDKLFARPESMYLGAEECFENLHRMSTLRTQSLRMAECCELSMKSNLQLSDALRKSKVEEFPLQPLAEFVRNPPASPLAFVASTKQRAERLADLLRSYQIFSEVSDKSFLEWQAAPGDDLTVLRGHLTAGFSSEEMCLIAERDVFPEHKTRRREVKRGIRKFLGEASQLKPDDYVVHLEHGVGLYRGLQVLDVGGMEGEFLVLEYAEAAKLILPIESISKLQKYVGAEGKKPKLNKLGGNAWKKTKKKVKEQVAELAGELINLYAERQLAEGHPFGPMNNDDQYFAETFEFDETTDQNAAIESVIADMAKPHPMDRLVCGDVGYGKTEVALRAAFKAANGGKQVAVLVPTTVLAAQHLANFKERFSTLPFKIAGLNRFFTTEENKATLSKLSSGKVDIVIGTHRLLQRDVQFQDLGLVIVDEEHRFGVKHKEKLKQMRKSVDVLTLTATPIPRTLHMSLLGIRDLSLIETAPVDRQVIRTYLTEYDEQVVREAILRELGRSGQVFYIHNRVQSIALVADELSDIVPEARIEFAHGQMKQGELEKVMHRFVKGEFDVLVSTTIVESGLDIPNANTIIIRKAEHFGLAELYQLRGRVGRSSKRAYAYLLISNPRTLGDEAKKRLKVLQSLDDLGMGFRLALQDMEIRGAGNLLGKDQSGQVNLVGYELYTKILKEAIHERRNEPRELDFEPDITIGFPSFIPPFFVPDVSERLLLYRRFVSLRTEQEARIFLEEIEDRFGHPPMEINRLYENALLRCFVRRAGIESLKLSDGELRLGFHPEAPLDGASIAQAVNKAPTRLRVTPSMSVIASTSGHSFQSPADIQQFLVGLLDELGV